MQRWLSAQIPWADAVRVQTLAVQRAEKKHETRNARKARGKQDRCGRRGSSSDSSGSSSSAGESSSASTQEMRRRKRLNFLLLAKEHPGVVVAPVTASTRECLGQIGTEADVGPQGPVF